jgi:ferredoxin
MDEIILTIDDQTVTVPAGTTILKAAGRVGKPIPTICYHDHCTGNGLCRICVVEVDGVRPLVPACLTPVRENMKVSTAGSRIRRSRRTILEMLASAIDLSEAPSIEQLIREEAADPMRFPQAERREHPLHDDTRCFCAIIPNAFSAGAAFRCARKTRSSPMPLTSAVADLIPASVRSLIRLCPKRPAFFADNASGFAPPARSSPSANFCWSGG